MPALDKKVDADGETLAPQYMTSTEDENEILLKRSQIFESVIMNTILEKQQLWSPNCCNLLFKPVLFRFGCTYKFLWVPLIIMTSFAMTVTAMYKPFMFINIMGQSPENFNVLRLVKSMFNDEIYWPTYLLIAFSICFPYFKLVSLFILWWFPFHNSLTRRFLRLVSYCGRFSLLDIFVELSVLVLAHNQGELHVYGPFQMKFFFVLFEVQIHIGLPIFISAIILNMIASETMCSLEVKDRFNYKNREGKPVIIRPNDNSGWRKVAVPILMVCTSVSLFFSLYMKIIDLTAIFMKPFSYNVIEIGSAMGEDRYYLFCMMTYFFLILMPIVKMICIVVFWYSKMKLDNLDHHNQQIKAIGKWSMLDVYVLAYCILMKTSHLFVPGVKALNGMYAFFVYLFFNYTLDIVTQCWIPRAQKLAERSEEVFSRTLVNVKVDVGDNSEDKNYTEIMQVPLVNDTTGSEFSPTTSKRAIKDDDQLMDTLEVI